MSILVIDVGTSGVRASVVHPDATVTHETRQATLPSSPVPGLVEFDATAYAEAALDCARARIQLGWESWTDIDTGSAAVMDWERSRRA